MGPRVVGSGGMTSGSVASLHWHSLLSVSPIASPPSILADVRGGCSSLAPGGHTLIMLGFFFPGGVLIVVL